jgi:hypothetical protein
MTCVIARAAGFGEKPKSIGWKEESFEGESPRALEVE